MVLLVEMVVDGQLHELTLPDSFNEIQVRQAAQEFTGWLQKRGTSSSQEVPRLAPKEIRTFQEDIANFREEQKSKLDQRLDQFFKTEEEVRTFQQVLTEFDPPEQLVTRVIPGEANSESIQPEEETLDFPREELVRQQEELTVNDEQVMATIARHEGTRNLPGLPKVRDEDGNFIVYRDNLKKKTIGIGHLWQEGDGEVWTEEKAYTVFVKDYKQHKQELEEKIEGYSFLAPEAKAILINMAFNLGVKRLKGFTKMWEALRETPPNYEKAAQEMQFNDEKLTPWFRQTKNRARELVMAMRKIKN